LSRELHFASNLRENHISCARHLSITLLTSGVMSSAIKYSRTEERDGVPKEVGFLISQRMCIYHAYISVYKLMVVELLPW